MEPTTFKSSQSKTKDWNTSLLIQTIYTSLELISKLNFISFLSFMVSQVQILSILVNIAVLSLKSNNTGLVSSLMNVHKVISLSGLTEISLYNTNAYIALYIIFFGLLLETIYIMHLLIATRRQYHVSRRLQYVFSQLIYLHPFMIFYPIHEVFIHHLYQNYQNPANNEHKFWIANRTLTLLVLIMNFMLSLVSLLIFQLRVRTKNPFSSKIYFINMQDLLFKLLIPLLWLLQTSFEEMSIVIIAMSILFSVSRDYTFFLTLPFYKVSTLKFAVRVYVALTLFAACIAISRVITSARKMDGLLLAISLWTLTVILFTRIYTNYLQKILIRIFCHLSDVTNPYFVTHFWDIYYYVSMARVKPTEFTRIFEENYFYYNSVYKHFWSQGINPSSTSTCTDSEVKTQFLRAYISVLEALVKKNPKSWLLKSILAIMYIKYKKLFFKADRQIKEALEISYTFLDRWSLVYNELKMIKKIAKVQSQELHGKEHQTGQDSKGLNISRYFKLTITFEKLRDLIKQEVDLIASFWKEFQSPTSELNILIKRAKQINRKREFIRRYWRSHEYLFESDYAQPIFTFGLYLEFVADDSRNGANLINKFDQIQEKLLAQTNIEVCQGVTKKYTNLSNCLYMAVSGSSGQLGTILDCSKNSKQILSLENSSLKGRSVNSLMPIVFGKRHDKLMREMEEGTRPNVLGCVRNIEILSKRGYLEPFRLCVSIYLPEKHGIVYAVLMEPVTDDKRIIIINEDGDLLNFSKNFAQDMNIDTDKSKAKTINILSICPEYEEIMKASNHHIRQRLDSIKGLNAQDSMLNHTSKKMDIKTAKERRNKSFEEFMKGGSISFEPILPFTTNNIKNKVKSISYNADINLHIYEDQYVLKMTMSRSTVDRHSPLEKKSDEFYKSSNSIKDNPVSNRKLYKLHISSSKQQEVTEKFNTNISILQSSSDEADTNFVHQQRLTNMSSRKSRLKKKLFTLENSSDNLKGSQIKVEDSDIITKSDFDNKTMISTRRYNEHQKLIHLSKTNISDKYVDAEKVMPLRRRVEFDPPKNNIRGDQIEVLNETFDKRIIIPQRLIHKNELLQVSPNLIMHSRPGKDLGRKSYRILDIINENSSSKSSKQDENKAISEALASRVYQSNTLFYYTWFFAILLAVLGVLIYLSLNVIQVSQEVNKLSTVLYFAYLRNLWIKLGNQETRLWTGVRGGIIDIPGIVDMTTEIATTNLAFHRINEYNHNLEASIGEIDQRIQSLFFQKNVKIYLRDELGDLQFMSLDNTFEATKKIINKGFVNLQKPIPEEALVDFIDKESRFIFDNSFDDLLVSSEYLISQVELYMAQTFSRSTKILLAILVAILILIAMFLLFWFRYTISITKDFFRFSNGLSTISLRETETVQSKLSAYQDFLNKDLYGTDHDKASNKSLNTTNTRVYAPRRSTLNKGSKSSIHRPCIKSVYYFMYRQFIALTICFLLLAATILAYYFVTLDRTQTMENQQHQINSALKYSNLNSLVSVQLQAMIMDNATTTIRHVDSLDSLKQSLNTLREPEFIRHEIKGEDKASSESVVTEIFINYPCENAYSPLYLLDVGVVAGECQGIAQGAKEIGLMFVISLFQAQLESFITVFESSERDAEDLSELYGVAINTFIQYIDVCSTLFLLSCTAVSDEFKTLIEMLNKQGAGLAALAVLLVVIIGGVCWQFIIRRVGRKKFDERELLSVIPSRLIATNPYLKRYLDISVTQKFINT